MQVSTPTPVFSFQSHQVRTIVEDGQPWFVSKDVCAVLGIDWSGKTLASIPADWQRMGKLPTLRRGTQNIRLISEPGLYKLAFRSNKPEADAFTNWVASEVLPTLRKTGKYDAAPKALPKPKQKALPAPEPQLAEKGVETMERMLRLRADVFRASVDVRTLLSSPFFRGPGNNETPEHQREFANALNEAASGFFMAINSNLTAVEQMFRAYVEAEQMLRR